MGFSRQIHERANAILAERRAKAERDADRRREEIYIALPEVREIDRKLAMTGAKILSVIGQDKETVAARMAEIERENEELQWKRAEVLASAGYPADYTEPHYTCDKCHDKGFIGSEECICRKRELVLAGYENSGIGELLKTQTFDSFDLSENPNGRIRAAFQKMRQCAGCFTGKGDGNFLLVGGTGLGKTHLSSAVAGELIERGFDVQYTTALDFVADFEAWRFHRQNGDEDPTERYTACDLLIVDDLGTEFTNEFVIQALYNVLDKRLNSRRAMIFSTNLTSQAIRRRYDGRISSRLFGNFTPIIFDGQDMRLSHLTN